MKKLSLLLLCLMALGLSSVCVADSDPPFTITLFHSFATLQPTGFTPTVCKHSDGTYTNVHVTSIGPITSDDPRMEGIFHGDAMILTNAQGIGISRDKWWITDAVTGDVKVTGVAQALDVDMTAPIHAINTARFADGSYMSNMAIVNLPSAATGGMITVEYGGPIPSDPGRAVVISRDCGGYFAADERGYKPRDQ